MKFLNTLFIVFLLTTVSALANEPDWTAYDNLLKQHVQPGQQGGIQFMEVDYIGIKKSPLYTQAISDIENFDTNSFDIKSSKGKNGKLAFYINAYNLYAIKMVIDHWPLESIKDAGHLFLPVWDKTAGSIDQKPVSLNDIEHKILRKMNEPRIHMAIVCASISCPDLRNEAYTSKKLIQQLDEQTTLFLNHPGKGLRLSRGVAKVSKIFDWFEEDFESSGGIQSFVLSYRKDLSNNIRVQAKMPYNWNLNKRSQ